MARGDWWYPNIPKKQDRNRDITPDMSLFYLWPTDIKVKGEDLDKINRVLILELLAQLPNCD
jgi:hypothetical protein